jgi:hypothetical protein
MLTSEIVLDDTHTPVSTLPADLLSCCDTFLTLERRLVVRATNDE